MKVDSVYFQCARAIIRSDLWNPAKHVDRKDLPTAGQILASITQPRRRRGVRPRLARTRAQVALVS